MSMFQEFWDLRTDNHENTKKALASWWTAEKENREKWVIPNPEKMSYERWNEWTADRNKINQLIADNTNEWWRLEAEDHDVLFPAVAAAKEYSPAGMAPLQPLQPQYKYVSESNPRQPAVMLLPPGSPPARILKVTKTPQKATTVVVKKPTVVVAVQPPPPPPPPPSPPAAVAVAPAIVMTQPQYYQQPLCQYAPQPYAQPQYTQPQYVQPRYVQQQVPQQQYYQQAPVQPRFVRKK